MAKTARSLEQNGPDLPSLTLDSRGDLQDAARQDVISFGPFRLFAANRLLEKDGTPVNLRGRAFDILLALVEHANQIVGKRDLVARVWPSLTVSEVSLRVQIAALRKALGDGQFGARYVINVNGRGYCFVTPIKGSVDVSPAADRSPNRGRAGLPADLARVVGRDETVRAILEELDSRRFVTIVGPGGIGKTTVAASVGRQMLAAFDDAVYFADLGALSDDSTVPSLLASVLGVPVNSDNPVPAVLAFLRDRRLLLILDSCEHLVDFVAALTESIFREAPKVHILTTSRESLRIEGEHLHRLTPLNVPPKDPSLTAAKALTFPAVRLFVERAAACGSRFELNNTNAPIIAGICRRLDGIALAIELAAGRVNTYGAQRTAALLDSQCEISWRGRRTAPPRHQTLGAMFDWSYNLLSTSSA